jgi:hypothetical protein
VKKSKVALKKTKDLNEAPMIAKTDRTINEITQDKVSSDSKRTTLVWMGLLIILMVLTVIFAPTALQVAQLSDSAARVRPDYYTRSIYQSISDARAAAQIALGIRYGYMCDF